MKKFIILIVSISCFSLTAIQAQNIDEKKMKTDLEVAEEILSTVLKQKLKDQSEYHYMCCENIESAYINNYGVRFEINSFNRPYVLYLSDVTRKGMETIEKTVDDIAEGKGKSEKKAPFKSSDLLSYTKTAAESFLVEYSHLIGQLNPTDKITISIGPRDAHRRQNNFAYSWGGTGTMKINNGPEDIPNITLTVLKADVDAYKQGKISAEVLRSKIMVDENITDNSPDEGAEVFSSVMDRIYSQDLSKTYYVSGQGLDYYRLEKVGIVFTMKVYSSNINDDNYSMPTLSVKGLSRAERNEKVKALYPQFISELKENILKYGSLITTLNDDALLMLKIGMTECIDCGLPTKLEVSVKKQTLKDYDSGRLGKDEALKKIEIKEMKEND